MRELNETYERIANILGEDTEEIESVLLVESYRRFLKPDRVKIVLLAESHVFTNADDRKIAIPSIAELPGYPTTYARFVYCLGYGEKSLTKIPLHPRRDGTPQFWKIFFSCLNPISSTADFAPILASTPYQQRIQNKIRLLKALKANGIWLVDASIVALYRDGRKPKNMLQALQESWQSYTRGVVVSSNPEHVICIGKGVAGIIESDLRKHFHDRYTVIPQPNAHLSSEAHLSNFKTYGRLCGLK